MFLINPENIAIYKYNGRLFLKKVSFSDLDYENDDLTTIDIALRYDWAECVIADGEPFFNAGT